MRPSASIWCRVLWLACACGVLLPALSAGAHSVPRASASASIGTHLHHFRTAPGGAERPNDLKPLAGGRLENADVDAESAERILAFSHLALLRAALPAPVDAFIAESRDRQTDAFHRFPLVFRFGPRPPPVRLHL